MRRAGLVRGHRMSRHLGLRRPSNCLRSSHSAYQSQLAIEPLEYRLTLTTLPAGFVETVVASGMASPTAMEFAPDGRLFVAQQTGQLRVIKDGALLPTPFISLTVNSSGERGLLGVAF